MTFDDFRAKSEQQAEVFVSTRMEFLIVCLPNVSCLHGHFGQCWVAINIFTGRNSENGPNMLQQLAMKMNCVSMVACVRKFKWMF